MATVKLDTKTVETFERQLGGTLLRPGYQGYDEVTSVWNAMVEKEPALIARCRGASDLIAALTFARNRHLQLAVKGGGHNVAGNGLCDDGLVIDLSPMDAVRVDPEAQTARVQGGATMADLDRETQTHSLAATGGIISSTGVAGLTLGGGGAG